MDFHDNCLINYKLFLSLQMNTRTLIANKDSTASSNELWMADRCHSGSHLCPVVTTSSIVNLLIYCNDPNYFIYITKNGHACARLLALSAAADFYGTRPLMEW